MANPPPQGSQSAQSVGPQQSAQQFAALPQLFTVVKTIESIRADTLEWGNLTGASTVVTLDSALITAAQANVASSAKANIRRFAFHEVHGPELTLRAVSGAASGAFTDTALDFFGTYDEAVALCGRELMLVHDDGRTQPAHVTSAPADLSLTGKDTSQPWMWPVKLDVKPQFDRADFDESAPKVTVYGNVVHATEGKTLAETPLGSGDARQTFQTFALPKAPLTYLLDATQTPAQTPGLTVYVDGMAWRKVDTLFDAAPDDQVYIVREDAAGASYVQFGDGKSGARLSSGRNNVIAVYRVGSGAYGALKPDTQPQATGKLAGLDKVFLPQPVTTGANAESEENARAAAPGRVQSLGRLVSIADFETETLALPHVTKANAAWAAPEGIPLVQVTVLTQSESDADATAVSDALAAYNVSRGPARFPIQVIRGLRQYLHVSVTAGFDPARRIEDVKAAIVSALGADGAEEDNARGVFALQARRFGQSAHVSQIVAAVQHVEGVVWATIKAAQPIALGNPPATDPLTLALPATESIPNPTLACANAFVLALHVKHLVINLVPAQTAPAAA